MSNHTTATHENWTAERVDLLKTMWAAGDSASQIATALNCSITRSAVLGKAHRLKLANHGALPRPKAVVAGPERPRRPASFRDPLLASTAASRSHAWAPLPDTAPVCLDDHVDGCRWPVGAPPYHFCNANVSAGSYCAVHHAISLRRAA